MPRRPGRRVRAPGFWPFEAERTGSSDGDRLSLRTGCPHPAPGMARLAVNSFTVGRLPLGHVRQPIRPALTHRTHVVATQRGTTARISLGGSSQTIFVDGHAQAGPLPQLDGAV